MRLRPRMRIIDGCALPALLYLCNTINPRRLRLKLKVRTKKTKYWELQGPVSASADEEALAGGKAKIAQSAQEISPMAITTHLDESHHMCRCPLLQSPPS